MSAASPSIKRQLWLEAAMEMLRRHMAGMGYTVPGEVRVSMGWPRGSHGRGRAIGQCWAREASADRHAEIFISPALGTQEGRDDSVTIIATLLHEMVHATVGHEAGHKGPFKTCALDCGLEGKMTATVPGPGVIEIAGHFIEANGPFPAGSLNDKARKKAGNRQLKCECTVCGYVCRTTKKWIEELGPPICPGGDSEGYHGAMICADLREGT